MESIKIKLARLPEIPPDFPLPAYATAGSSGMDLHAAVVTESKLKSGERMLVPCGFQMEIPSGFEAQIRPRSGLAIKNGVTVLNTPGTIDSDYRGEVKVILINMGKDDFLIKRGDRIAQMVIAPVTRVELDQVERVSETVRGAGGFGHTGS